MLDIEHRFKVKLRMRIGELAGKTGVAASRIRFYERHGVLPKAARNPNGYRVYPETAAKALVVIDRAQQLGFSLSEIRRSLGEAAPGFPSHAATIRLLRGKLESIDQHMREVRARRREVVRLLRDMECSDARFM